MRKHKRKFEDYEEIALCLRTAKQLLYRTEVIFHRAPYADAMTTIYKKLDRMRGCERSQNKRNNCCLSRNGAPTLERDGSIKKRRAIK